MTDAMIRGRTFKLALQLAMVSAVAFTPSRAHSQQADPRRPDLRGLPFTLPYRSDEPAPANYVLDTRPLYGLITAGSVLVGVSYVVPLAIAGATGFEDHSGWLAVPVAGPFLWQKRSCADASNRLEDKAGCGSMWPLLALPQLTGFTLLTVGLVLRKRHFVRQDLALIVFPSFGGHQVGIVGEL